MVKALLLRWRASRRDESGQALVEFALTVPILLLLVIAVFEFGRAWQAHLTITDAAREGARTAVLATPTTQAHVDSLIQFAVARSALNPAWVQITYPTGFQAGAGLYTTVHVEYPYQFRFLSPLIKLAPGITNGIVWLKTEFVMRNEG